jgi:hypothetical protein
VADDTLDETTVLEEELVTMTGSHCPPITCRTPQLLEQREPILRRPRQSEVIGAWKASTCNCGATGLRNC